MDDSFALDKDGGFIEKRDEDVDGDLRVGLREASNKELFFILFNPDGGVGVGGRGQDNIGERDYLPEDLL